MTSRKKPGVALWATVGLVACAVPGIACHDAFVSLTLAKFACLALGIMALAR